MASSLIFDALAGICINVITQTAWATRRRSDFAEPGNGIAAAMMT